MTNDVNVYVGTELDIAGQIVRFDPVKDENGEPTTSLSKMSTEGCEMEMTLADGQTSLKLASIDDIANMFGFDKQSMGEEADELERDINEALNKLGKFTGGAPYRIEFLYQKPHGSRSIEIIDDNISWSGSENPDTIPKARADALVSDGSGSIESVTDASNTTTRYLTLPPGTYDQFSITASDQFSITASNDIYSTKQVSQLKLRPNTVYYTTDKSTVPEDLEQIFEDPTEISPTLADRVVASAPSSANAKISGSAGSFQLQISAGYYLVGTPSEFQVTDANVSKPIPIEYPTITAIYFTDSAGNITSSFNDGLHTEEIVSNLITSAHLTTIKQSAWFRTDTVISQYENQSNDDALKADLQQALNSMFSNQYSDADDEYVNKSSDNPVNHSTMLITLLTVLGGYDAGDQTAEDDELFSFGPLDLVKREDKYVGYTLDSDSDISALHIYSTNLGSAQIFAKHPEDNDWEYTVSSTVMDDGGTPQAGGDLNTTITRKLVAGYEGLTSKELQQLNKIHPKYQGSLSVWIEQNVVPPFDTMMSKLVSAEIHIDRLKIKIPRTEYLNDGYTPGFTWPDIVTQLHNAHDLFFLSNFEALKTELLDRAYATVENISLKIQNALSSLTRYLRSQYETYFGQSELQKQQQEQFVSTTLENLYSQQATSYLSDFLTIDITPSKEDAHIQNYQQKVTTLINDHIKLTVEKTVPHTSINPQGSTTVTSVTSVERVLVKDVIAAIGNKIEDGKVVSADGIHIPEGCVIKDADKVTQDEVSRLAEIVACSVTINQLRTQYTSTPSVSTRASIEKAIKAFIDRKHPLTQYRDQDKEKLPLYRSTSSFLGISTSKEFTDEAIVAFGLDRVRSNPESTGYDIGVSALWPNSHADASFPFALRAVNFRFKTDPAVSNVIETALSTNKTTITLYLAEQVVRASPRDDNGTKLCRISSDKKYLYVPNGTYLVGTDDEFVISGISDSSRHAIDIVS
jgi:hypothetical protein